MYAGDTKLLKSVVCLASGFAALNWGLEYFGFGWSSWGIATTLPWLDMLVAYTMLAVGILSLLWWLQCVVMGKHN